MRFEVKLCLESFGKWWEVLWDSNQKSNIEINENVKFKLEISKDDVIESCKLSR